jgi:hypothetical protein
VSAKPGKKSAPVTATPITTVREALDTAKPRPAVTAEASEKKNYAQRFSNALAICIANRLRSRFKGITPDERGQRLEERARTAKGFKKLDVNYSTVQLGLALGVSVKSVTHPDYAKKTQKVGRFTKNYTRIDAELRAEATDYHQRQPYAVLVAVLFLPIGSYNDAGKPGKKAELGISSFGAAVRAFRPRANRKTPRNDVDLFEEFFVAAYDETSGDTCFFNVNSPPPKNRPLNPSECLSFEQFIEEIVKAYEKRNNPAFQWAE